MKLFLTIFGLSIVFAIIILWIIIFYNIIRNKKGKNDAGNAINR